jgi:hypothetical protein
VDTDTRDFILKQYGEVTKKLDVIRSEIEGKFEKLQDTLNNFSGRLGEGAEKFNSIDKGFKRIDQTIEGKEKNNDKIHKILFWLIGLLYSGMIGLFYALHNLLQTFNGK